MKVIRQIGSVAFVAGLFVVVFAGVPWHVMAAKDPVVPWWLRIAVFCLLGGILVVLLTLALEQTRSKPSGMEEALPADSQPSILLLNSAEIPDRSVRQILGMVQGHTVFAIWLGKDLSALIRLILGGELTEYTEMMGKARTLAADRMVAEAEQMGADAIINVRYMTTSVVGSAAELLVYGTAVKLSE